MVEHGSFTAAADALGVSTSFVSRQVRQLEQRLRARLLHRTTRSVTLTELGRVYYDGAREILDQLLRLESEMADLQERPKGLVRVTAAGLYAEEFVAPALAEFTTRYPDVQVELDTSMHVVDMVEQGFDLAVRMSALDDSTLVARKVRNRRLIVAGSPDYFSRHPKPGSPDDLRQHNCLRIGTMAWRFAYADGIVNIPVRGSWRSDSGRALVNAAIAGIGLVRATDYYLEPAFKQGLLEPVLEAFEPPDAATWLLYPDRHYLPTRVRFLVDHLAQTLR